MKTSLTSLWATSCALLIFLSPARGECVRGPDDTVYLRCLIDNPNAQGQVTIPQGSYITRPIRLPGNLELTLAAGVVIEPVADIFEAMFGEAQVQEGCGKPSDPDDIDCLNCPNSDKCECEGCSCVYWAAYQGNYDPTSNDPNNPGYAHFNKLFMAKDVSNLTIIGMGSVQNGDQAKLRMRGAGVEYPFCSEYIHALALVDVANVEVRNLNIEDTGGDGILIQDGDIVNVRDCNIDSANRNGISIISGTDITIEGCTLTGKIGTSPQAGIDIEPEDHTNNDLVRIRIKGCTAQGNGIRGFFVELEELNQSSLPVDILFEDCVVNGDFHPTGYGFDVRGNNIANHNKIGTIEFINCKAIAPDQPSSLFLANHINLEWDLRSLITLKFVNLRLEDYRDDDNKLIKVSVRGRQPQPLSDRIVIKGTATGSNDPLIEVVRVCSLDITRPCNNNTDCTGFGTCPTATPTPYPEISGCMYKGSHADGDAGQTNVSVETVTPDCGNGGTPEACEECDDGNTTNGDGCDSNCFIESTTIYAQWDNPVSEEDRPLLDINYRIVGAPDSPDVELRTGRSDWRVWSVKRNNINDIGDIGVLSSPVDQDFSVKLMRPDGAPAARHVKGITLVPTDPGKYANIAAGEIAGDLGLAGLGGLVVQQSSGGAGGFASVTIGGNLDGDIDIRTVGTLEVKGAVLEDSTITLGEFAQFFGLAGQADFNTVDGSFAGDLNFETGLPHLTAVSIRGQLTETALVNFQGGELEGTLSLHNGSEPGSTMNIGPMTTFGGDRAELFLLSGTYAGNITVTSVEYPGVIDADVLTGNVNIPGLFDGDICGSNFWVQGHVFLPPNVQISAFGDHGTVCGQQCRTDVVSADTSADKSRFISFTTADPTRSAIRVDLVSLHHVEPPYSGGPSIPFTSFEGQIRWVGPPTQYNESQGNPTPFYASSLQCDPHYQDWRTVGLLHVTGSAIVPSSQYAVQLVPEIGAACSTPVNILTTRWGDVETPYNPPSPSTQPDFGDIAAIVNKFYSAPGALIKARAKLASGDGFGNITTLDVDVGFNDIASCVDAIYGKPYGLAIQSCSPPP